MKSTKEEEERKNAFDKYTSDIDHILIPLHNFRQYHQTGSDKLGDAGFVGRQTIISKLKNWITNENTLTGAYLVTGYRGMGKSSFVGKVLYELTRHSAYASPYRYLPSLSSLFFVVTLALLAFVIRYCIHCKQVSFPFSLDCFFSEIACPIFFCYVLLYVWRLVCTPNRSKSEKRNRDNGKRGITYIPIHLNIGNELLTRNDEILRLIIKSVYNEFSAYINHTGNRLLYSYTSLCVRLTLTAWIVTDLHFLTSDTDGIENSWLRFLIETSHSFVGHYKAFSVALAAVLVYLLLCFIQKKISIWMGRLSIPTLEGIKEQLHTLYLRSIAAVDEDHSSFFQRIPMILQKKKFDKATVREMEQSLVDIFEDISRLRFQRLRFVFALDELDKVETSPDEALKPDENDAVPSYEASVSGFAGTVNARRRKKELMKTLGSMKYFLSTVKAKFIFIAGRELYDAYLADVSDREFAISSVFDGVINVNSFLKSSDSAVDITSMTEEYICQFLMPENMKKRGYGYTLADYHRYSDEVAFPNKKERNFRNTAFLYQYVMYLVHMSNGSPKKIAVYFEKDIRSREHIVHTKKMALEDDAPYYLSFGIKDIWKIGFIHYLAYPIMQAMIGKSRIYEDKLLVSSSFMISHIFKFHNIGFSWRNLEHIPELLDMNKTPELRDFLGTIIGLLSQTHLATIQSGLYLFKFPMKITEEISFLSRRIEDISALFHFSKDESLPVKRHYMHLLEYYTDKRNQTGDEELYILASIHHILADIYLADEDYSLAIYEYQTGLQLAARQIAGKDADKNPHWISSMLFIVRNTLKLSVAFEKRKTFDSAYVTYCELLKRLIDYRQLEEGSLGLKYRLEKKDSLKRKAILYVPSEGEKPDNRERKTFLPQEWEDDIPCHYAFQADHLGYELSHILSPESYAVLIRQSFFYDLRLAFLPILGKLAVLEKMDAEGITRDNLDLAEAEFFYLHVFVNDSDKPMIYSDFFQKLGDILYYKNGLTQSADNNLFQALALHGFDLKHLAHELLKNPSSQSAGFDLKGSKRIGSMFDEPETETNHITTRKELAQHIYCKMKGNASGCSSLSKIEDVLNRLGYDEEAIRKARNCMIHRSKLFGQGKKLPCYACKYYRLSFESIMKRILHAEPQEGSEPEALMLWLIGNRAEMKAMKEAYLLLVANTLKGLANVMLGCSDESCAVSEDFLNKLFYSFARFYNNKERQSLKGSPFQPADDFNSLEKSMLLYMEAGMFFDKAGSKNNAVQMFRQIIELLNFYLRIARYMDDKPKQEERIRIISTHLGDIQLLVNQAITILYGHYDSVNVLEIEKLKDLFGKGLHEDIPLLSLPLFPDVEELIYRYLSLEIRCGNTGCIKHIYPTNLMGRYKQISTLSQNIQNLRFKFLMNETIFTDIFRIKRTGNLIDLNQAALEIARYFQSEENICPKLKASYGIAVEGADRNRDPFMDKIDALNFFVVDNLSCLSKITNHLQPINNPTLFVSYFLGDISLYTEYWTRIYNLLFMLYADVDKVSRGDSLTNTKVRQDEYEMVRGNSIYLDLCKYIAAHKSGQALSQQLENYLKRKAGNSNKERLTWHYNAELAILNYNKAIEMHTEGRAYKEMMSTLYFLDDDLNNDILQQQLAIERYLINSGNIDKRIEQMREKLAPSRIFKIENYVELK